MNQDTLHLPSEALKETANARRPLLIGIPKENKKTEKRLAFTPEAVDMLVEAGHSVVFEAGAGEGIRYSDVEFSEAGAVITPDRETVFGCDLLFKITPPTLEEIGLMKKRATVLSLLQMPDLSVESLRAMTAKQMHALGYELMTPNNRCFPVRNSISEIEGAAAISVASELLSNEKGGKGVLLGGVPGVSPTEVVIIGAGVAGTVAARAAMALGATVKVFDSDIDKLRKLQRRVETPVFTSVFQPHVLVNAFESADVVIGAMRYIDDSVRYVISEDVIRTMKQGSALIDLRINQGGCFETTCFLPPEHPPVYEKYGVVHYCIPNLSSRVARTTAMALSNIFTPLLLQIGDRGGVTATASAEPMLRSGFYMYAGKPVNHYVAKYFNLAAHDINLFLSVF
jgi:alanine dehydrogenase